MKDFEKIDEANTEMIRQMIGDGRQVASGEAVLREKEEAQNLTRT